ncbi:PREDICTED: membrane-bound transcription factor site-2 protease homolog isoform X2 [Tarenaya hassleriana]|nr:PREDICTED: membrane-bound transcription factor site-2 protease homolog isoform X2 [Tarenaya hassleriana]XP_010529325.1 PREDICTED: membrane-bound transcription factor site-2 protease homolog isoform X2 [Tarenaya hassleriana]XP_010529326.1 PREDICTED: membrane-bound transcription factor site-2 protease homolog isoform X2 [Tarenaya hassleriana]
MEYIAVFMAAIFPGGLVAFDHDVLEALPRFNTLRVYCAGIWHNAVFCAVCALTLFLLPVILSPFYIHGDSPMVLDVPSTSPLFGYLSAGEVIVSLDGIRVHNPKEWLELAALLDKYNSERSNSSLGRFHHRKGYCVPLSLIEKGYKVEMTGNLFVCPGDLSAFVPMPCLRETTSSHDKNGKDDQPIRGKSMICLDAKDIVKLNKCGDGWVTSDTDEISCICSQGESCLHPVESPGVSWTEITYRSTSPNCSRIGGSISLVVNTSKNSPEHDCLGSFVFVGDLIATAHSVHLTSYQPRRVFSFGIRLPDILERSLICTFHVSLALVLLNSLPVYYLDGESILETSLEYLGWSSSRRRKKALQVCLIGGTFLSASAFFRIFVLGYL